MVDEVELIWRMVEYSDTMQIWDEIRKDAYKALLEAIKAIQTETVEEAMACLKPVLGVDRVIDGFYKDMKEML